MSAFDDDLLSVRHGTPQGKSTENRLLSAMGGTATIKKRFQNNVDGSIVMAHTRGEWAQPEFITALEKIPVVAICSVEMDSGIIDLRGFGDFNPSTLLPGIVYRTNYVESHVGSSASAIGCGELQFPSFTGQVVAEGAIAKEFSSSFSGGTSYSERKKLAATIPASLFTGRTRLYVQSLYGGNWPGLIIQDASVGAGRPYLSVSAVGGYPDVQIHSGSGVYFDNATKSHFLITPGQSSATITPLIRSVCAEKYRLLLVEDESLSEADKERIEAYILSQSIPFAPAEQVVDYEVTPSEGLGYSWHFNWDGNKCDIVNVDELYIPSGSCYGFETTHFRLEFSVSNGVFSVVRSVVSGPSQWAVPKNTNVIAYPDWFSRRLNKAGNLPSIILPGSHSGAVYCFYRKNELQVLSVNTETIATGSSVRTSAPIYFGGTYPPYRTGFLNEEESGSTTSRTFSNGTSCYFSIGGISVGGYTDNSTKTVHTEDWWKRIPFVEATGSGYDSDHLSQSYMPSDIIPFDNGAPDIPYSTDGIGRIEIGSPITYPDRAEVTGVTFVSFDRRFFCAFWKKYDSSIIEVRSAKTLIVIPFQDAEAVYISDQNISVETGTETTGEISGIDVWGETSLDVIYPGGSGYVRYGDYKPLRSTVGWPTRAYVAGTTSSVDRTTTTSSKHLVSSNGSFDVPVFPSEGTFYSTASYVSQLYATVSSVNGVTNAPDTGAQVGSTIFPNVFSIVGWA